MSEPLNLGDSPIIAASADATGSVITTGVDGVGYLSGLGAYSGANLEINFTYGSGGATLKVVIETTFNQGSTWVEVYRAAFSTSSGERVVNVSASTPITSPLTPAALSDDTVKDGVFGDRWRARKIVGGTPYAGNSSVSVRMQPR